MPVAPIPEELVSLPIALDYPLLIDLQATYGGVPTNPSVEDLMSCLHFCARVLDTEEPEIPALKRKLRTAEARRLVKLQTAKRAAEAWLTDICYVSRLERRVQTVPIPPILLLSAHGTEPSHQIIAMHAVYGGIPLPVTQATLTASLEFVALVIAGLSRPNGDKGLQKREREAAEKLRAAVYAATRTRVGMPPDFGLARASSSASFLTQKELPRYTK